MSWWTGRIDSELDLAGRGAVPRCPHSRWPAIATTPSRAPLEGSELTALVEHIGQARRLREQLDKARDGRIAGSVVGVALVKHIGQAGRLREQLDERGDGRIVAQVVGVTLSRLAHRR